MATQRQLRVGEEIRHELASVFMRGDVPWPADFGKTPFITVTEVQVSPDLRNAYAFIMPLGGERVAETVKILNKIAGFFRHDLAKSMKLRYVPVVRFKADTSFDYAENIEKILHDPKVVKDLTEVEKDALSDDADED
jgi:ribosome-binding factor A